MANQCRAILVKDHGVYFLAERGERRPDGRQKTIAYAAGCNPDDPSAMQGGDQRTGNIALMRMALTNQRG